MAKDGAKIKVKVQAVPVKGFCRIGQRFVREPKEIEVTAAQLEILKAEKNLVVVELGPVVPEKDDKKK